MPQPEPSQPVAAPRHFPWCRLFQFRVRTILILTAIIAVALGWWSRKARQQREAVAALRKAGAFIQYDFQASYHDHASTPNYWPTWLVDVLGVDYFAHVRLVAGDKNFTDAGLEHIQRVKTLPWLRLNNTKVTDAGLKNLESLTALKYLSLDNTNVTDIGLESLCGLTDLLMLDLNNTKATDAGIARLQKALPHCMVSHDRPIP